MEKVIIQACTDLGVNIKGSEMGPIVLLNNIDFNGKVYKVNSNNYLKCNVKDVKLKNLDGVNKFNMKLYSIINKVIESNSFPITLGGDHSLSIATSLASINKYNNLGIIWIDSHGDFNNEDTTISGNIHGMPFAAVTGYKNNKLTSFHNGEFYNPKNSVLVGARSLDEKELINLKEAGITIFTTDDIKEKGIDNIMRQAIEITGSNTNGIHVSFDVDIIDPIIAPGVSIPENNGIYKNDVLRIMQMLKEQSHLVKSLDLVEFNPNYDVDNSTLNIVVDLIDIFIENK